MKINRYLILAIGFAQIFACERTKDILVHKTNEPLNDIQLKESAADSYIEPLFPGGFPHSSSPFFSADNGDDDFLAGGVLTGIGVPAPICGNGRVEPAEQCDDGDLDNENGCNVLCLFPICGNGLLEEFEECDDNNNQDDDGCSADCIYERCGNKRVDSGEQCDDGNKTSGDGCSPCCKFEHCGNSVIDPGEACDDGNTASGDGCSDCCDIEDTKLKSV